MSEPIIAVEHVSKSVTDSTGTLDILRDVDFTLAPRETVAIVGASGSGKSTLLSIIAGLDTPTRGTVRLEGHDLFALGSVMGEYVLESPVPAERPKWGQLIAALSNPSVNTAEIPADEWPAGAGLCLCHAYLLLIQKACQSLGALLLKRR